MNTLLHMANGALQYHRGKQTGLFGLIGIAVAVLIAYQWENVHKFLDKIGLVSLLDKVGLIVPGEPALTGLGILMTLVKLQLILIVLLIVALGIMALLGNIYESELGFKIIFTICLIPVIMCMTPYYIIKYSILKKNDKNPVQPVKTALEMMDECSVQISNEKAELKLNRLPTSGDGVFLIGRTFDDELYLLIPGPMGYFENMDYEGPYVGVQFTLEKYNSLMPDKNKGLYFDKNFDIHEPIFVTDYTVPKNNRIEHIKKESIVCFYETKNPDLVHLYRSFILNDVFTEYIKRTVHNYFARKEHLLSIIQSASSKDEFDEGVASVVQLTVPNEEIVKIMMGSVKEGKIS